MAPTASIGLIAGSGDLPLIFALRARKKNIPLQTVAIRGEASFRLNQLSEKIIWISIGQVGSLLAFFKKQKVKRAVMHGKIQHARYFKNIRLDWKALALWTRLKDRSGEGLLKGLADELLKEGTKVVDGRFLMKDILIKKGWHTSKRAESSTLASIRYGLSRARVLARLGVGQTLMIKKNAVVAVEAMEGTDATIRRAGKIAGPGTILVKVTSPRQDWRFDVPVIGLKTIEVLAKAGARGIVLESGHAFFLDREKALAAAEKKGIFVLGA